MVRLYTFTITPNNRKVEAFVRHFDLDVDIHHVSFKDRETQSPEYRAGTLPIGLIARYINRLHKNYTGYYGKDPILFAPALPTERNALIADLAGGNGRLLETAPRLLREGNFQLALEVLDVVTTNEPENREAHRLKAKAFAGLARATTHNWYRMVSYMNAARKEEELCCGP